MKLTYIYHSGFAVDFGKHVLIIDYYQEPKKNHVSREIVANILKNKDKKIYVLSTHSHHDHFGRDILTWKDQRPDLTYIFSKDILDNGLAKADEAIYLGKLETYQDDTISVKAYGSTDIGGSFLIETQGKRIFHAGDLNNWHWNEEVSEAEALESERFYLSELALLANDVSSLNLAMFPVDPRLGKDFARGAEQFISTIKTDILVPMHFGEAYTKVEAFEQTARDHGTQFALLKHRGDSINF